MRWNRRHKFDRWYRLTVQKYEICISRSSTVTVVSGKKIWSTFLIEYRVWNSKIRSRLPQEEKPRKILRQVARVPPSSGGNARRQIGTSERERRRCGSLQNRGKGERRVRHDGGGTEKLKHREENIRDSRGTAWWLNFAKTVKWPAMNHAPPPAAFLLCFWRPNILRRGSVMPA